MNSVMDNKFPKVSVLLPVYNCEKYINESVDSILNQTFTDFELIIIDDKSTDNTLNIVKKYNDKRIIVFEKNQNSGYTNSLNYGISIAKGEFIARMDADDISLPTRFEEQIKILDNHQEIVLCGTNGRILNSTKELIKPEKNDDIFYAMFISNPMIHPSVMIRKKALKNNLYNPLKEPSEDYDLWSRLIFFGKFYNIQKVLLLYRKHDNNTSSINNSKQTKNYLESKTALFSKLNFNFGENTNKLIEKYFIKNEKIENENNFIEVLDNLKKTEKKQPENSFFSIQNYVLVIKKLEIYFIYKFFKQNKFYNNIKYLKYISISQFFKIANFYIKNKK